MRAHVWPLETNDKGKLAGVPADITVDYGIHIVENGSRYEVSFQLTLDDLPPLTQQMVSRPGFPANFTRELDPARFSAERLKEGTMSHEEIASLTLPPHHGPRAENARLNLPFALLNQPEEPKIMPLRLAVEFNKEKEAKTPPAPHRKRARKPPGP